MRRWVAIFLIALLAAGCTPAQTQTEGAAETQYVVAPIPMPPEAEGGNTIYWSTYIHVDQAASEVLSWYASELSQQGWETVPTGLPSDRVLLVTRGGQYLSLSASDLAGELSSGRSVVWFSLRSGPEVTEQQALSAAIMVNNPDPPAEWTAEYIPEFESDRYGAGVKHPVWKVEGRREGTLRLVVYVDAITAEPFRVGNISGP